MSPGEQVRSGFLWVTGLNIFRDVLQFATMLVLVRRLDVSAYGEFSLVTSLVGFFTVFSFRSFLEHTLQLRPGQEPDYQNHFAIGGLIQAAVIVAMNLVAAGLRFFPAYAPVAPLVHVMSLFFVLDWMGELRVKMLERSLNWRRLRTLEATGLMLSATCALTLAFAGAGVYALLVPGTLMTLPFIFDLFLLERWRPRWTVAFHAFRDSFHYGLARLGSGAVVTGRQLAESAMLAQLIGFAGAGVYGRAAGLAYLACVKVPSLLTLMLYPVLSRFEPRSSSSRRAASLVLQSVAWGVIPAAALLFVLHEPVVRILYGQKWMAASPLIPWTVCAAAVAAISQAASMLLLSNIRQKNCLYGDLILLGGVLLSLFFLLPLGVTPYIAGLAVSQAISAVAMLWWLHRAQGVDAGTFTRVFGVPTVAAVTVGAPALFLVHSYPVAEWNLIPVVIFSFLFVTLYLVVLRALAVSSLSELFSYCPGGKHLRRLLWIGA